MSTGTQGQALIHCQAGCPPQTVLGALGLTFRDLRDVRATDPAAHAQNLAVRYPPMTAHSGPPAARGLRLESRHDYGQHVLERWRHEQTGAKEMTWFTRSGDNGVLVPGLMGTPLEALPLYYEHDIRMATAADEPVVIVESESSTDALVRAGINATTWAGGASNPNLDRLEGVLAGGRVIICPDNDPPGLECGRRIWVALRDHSNLKAVVPDDGQDARDVLNARGPEAFDWGPSPPAADTSTAWHDDYGHVDQLADAYTAN